MDNQAFNREPFEIKKELFLDDNYSGESAQYPRTGGGQVDSPVLIYHQLFRVYCCRKISYNKFLTGNILLWKLYVYMAPNSSDIRK